jgi:hypothetical protein
VIIWLKIVLSLLAFAGLGALCWYWTFGKENWTVGKDKSNGRVDSLWRDEHTPETKPVNIKRKT